MVKEKIIEFKQQFSTDPGFHCRLLFGKVEIEIIDDDYGDSVTGFGASLSYCLDRKQTIQLRDYLNILILRLED